jgi:hypothetical protein
MIGEPDFLRMQKIIGLEPLEASAMGLQEEGKTAMFLAVDKKPTGILAVTDAIKPTTHTRPQCDGRRSNPPEKLLMSGSCAECKHVATGSGINLLPAPR